MRGLSNPEVHRQNWEWPSAREAKIMCSWQGPSKSIRLNQQFSNTGLRITYGACSHPEIWVTPPGILIQLICDGAWGFLFPVSSPDDADAASLRTPVWGRWVRAKQNKLTKDKSLKQSWNLFRSHDLYLYFSHDFNLVFFPRHIKSFGPGDKTDTRRWWLVQDPIGTLWPNSEPFSLFPPSRCLHRTGDGEPFQGFLQKAS